MGRRNQNSRPAYTCACFRIRAAPSCSVVTTQQHPIPTRGRRLLGAATVAAALLVGVNALVQALNVLAAWWRHAG